MGAYFDLAKGETSGLSFNIPEQLHKAAFSTSDWNRMKRDALMAAGWRFIRKYLPLRFTDYARRHLGYRSRLEQKWAKGMAKHLPLVDSGQLRDRMLVGAYPQVAAAAKALFIRTPFAHPLRPEHAAVLQRLTSAELADLNAAAQEQLAADLMEAGSTGHKRAGVAQLGLAPPQRAAIAFGLKDRAGARYHLTAVRGSRAA